MATRRQSRSTNSSYKRSFYSTWSEFVAKKRVTATLQLWSKEISGVKAEYVKTVADTSTYTHEVCNETLMRVSTQNQDNREGQFGFWLKIQKPQVFLLPVGAKYRRVNSNTNTHDPTEDWVELKEHPSLPVFSERDLTACIWFFFKETLVYTMLQIASWT